MTNEFEKQLEIVHENLFNDPIVAEYFSLKKQIENDSYLTDLYNNIVIYAKAMTTNINDDQVYFENKEKYERELEKYNSHPLIVDFKEISKEVNMLLLQLKKIIN